MEKQKIHVLKIVAKKVNQQYIRGKKVIDSMFSFLTSYLEI